MCKKLCIAVGAVIVGLLAVTFVPRVSVKAHKMWESASHWANEVAPEDQLKQLRGETDKIDQDIKKNLFKLAQQEVETERLDKSLADMKERQTSLRAEIAEMNKALDSKETKVSYNGKTYRPSELALRLQSKVNDYELRKTEVKTRQDVLDSKHQALEVAHQRIAAMREQKDQLRLDIAKLESRIENLKLKKVDCAIEADDTHVTKCRAMADKLNRDLAEQEVYIEKLKEYGYDKEASRSIHEEKTIEEVRQSAKKALQDDDDAKVVEKK